MDRSLAGRLGIGGLISQPNRGRPSAARRPSRRRAVARGPNALDVALGRLAALLAAAARVAGGGWGLLRRRRRLRIALIVVLIASPLLAGGWLWLRGSSLVAVRHVRVSGAQGAQGRAIEAALSAAARRMTTLDVHAAALRSAVASYPVVSSLRISTSLPHGLSIRVIERPAVAALTVSGAKTAVAADGTALGPAFATGSLPIVAGGALPAPGRRLRDASLLGALAALGAAPAQLSRQVTRAYSSGDGLTLAMRSGLLAYFGDATRPHAKWLSLARVLADPSSAGASYVDVRVPERPAAGFPGGVAPASASQSEASGSGSTGGESTEALAEGLTAAVGGGSAAGAAGSSAGSSGEAEEAGEASSPSGEEAAGASPREAGG
jgi:cell division protein FtsQ